MRKYRKMNLILNKHRYSVFKRLHYSVVGLDDNYIFVFNIYNDFFGMLYKLITSIINRRPESDPDFGNPGSVPALPFIIC